MATIQVQNERPSKSSTACNNCRLKKVKCNGGTPCPNCTDHGRVCTYPTSRRRNTRRSTSLKNLHERLAKVEALLPTTQEHSPTLPDRPPQELVTFESGQITFLVNPSDVRQQRPTIVSMESSGRTVSSELNTFAISDAAPPTSSPATLDCAARRLMLAVEMATPPDDEELGALSPPEEETTYEYHGPGSLTTICSKSGMEWVIGRTGVPDFTQMARKFSSDLCHRMRLDQRLSREREPEPDPETAWRYCQAYFDETDDSMFGTVCRASFESRLREQFSHGPISSADEDPAWYALRHVVYATGCRYLLSKEDRPGAFAEAYEGGWKFFQNALSVHTDLLFVNTSLLAVQALAAMMFYAEGIKTPDLNLMLCSNAMRLAESKGLHRQPATAWNLREADLQSRRYIWWAIYCYDVHLALRSGRPLATDGGSITCQLPSEVIQGSTVKLEIVISAIQHARMSSEISRSITALKSSQPKLADAVRVVAELDGMVRKWKETLPLYIRSDAPVSVSDFPPGVRPCEAVYLRHAYHWSLIQIHSILFHPWTKSSFGVDDIQQPEWEDQIMESTNIVVEASRNIIQQLGHATIRCSTPKWSVLLPPQFYSFESSKSRHTQDDPFPNTRMVIFSPLLAVINLFIYVLHYPTLPSADSDITLMYLVAGHFSYFEYATSDVAFSFPREMAHLARSMVIRMRENERPREETSIPSPPESAGDGGIRSIDKDIPLPNVIDLDEAWSTTHPWPDPGSWMDVLQDGDVEDTIVLQP